MMNRKKSKRSLKNVQADDLEKKKDAAKEKAEFAKKCLEEYEDFVPMFLLLDETARVLREKRMARGAVDFDFPECKINPGTQRDARWRSSHTSGTRRRC